MFISESNIIYKWTRLPNRSIFMYFNGVSLSPQLLNGSLPKSAFLVIFFCIVKFRPPVPRNTILHFPQSLAKRKDDNCSTHDPAG